MSISLMTSLWHRHGYQTLEAPPEPPYETMKSSKSSHCRSWLISICTQWNNESIDWSSLLAVNESMFLCLWQQIFGSWNRWSHRVVITPGYFLLRGYISWGHLPLPPLSPPGPSTAVSILNLERHYHTPRTQPGLREAGSGGFIHDGVSPRSFPRLWAQTAGISAPVSCFQLAGPPGVWSLRCDVGRLTSVQLGSLTYCSDMWLRYAADNMLCTSGSAQVSQKQ